MKKLTIIIFVLCSFTSFGQGDIDRHFIIGYGIGTNSFTNAYSNYHQSGALPLDLTTVDFNKDRFNHSSFLFKSAIWKEMGYLESDISFLTSAIGEVLRSAISQNKEKQQNLPSSGKLKNVNDNLNGNALAVGRQADMIRFEGGFNISENDFYIGAVWGIGSWGIVQQENINSPTRGIVTINTAQATTQTLGVWLAKGLENSLGPALVSTQINTVAMKYKDQEDVKRRGFESKTMLKIYSESTPGLYVEAYYKFQRFKPFESPAYWNNTSNGENGTMPSVVTNAAGLNVGFYFNY
jgi:hypothetical protein